jgi:hypothetical protein
MTDNLVERLRGYCDGNNDLMDGAADRIEQLEAALKEIQCDCTTLCGATGHTEPPNNNCLNFIARAALAGEKNNPERDDP